MSAPLSRVDSGLFVVPDIDRTTATRVFGAAQWEEYFPGLQVLDEAVEPPSLNWHLEDPFFKRPYYENYCLLYIPQEVVFQNQKQIFSVDLLEMMLEKAPTQKVEYEKGSLGHFILMSKNLLPNTQGWSYEGHCQLVHSQEFCIPTVLEALAFSMMVFKATGERLFTDSCTRCKEIGRSFESVYVGGDGWGSFHVQLSAENIGAAASILRFG